LGGHLFHQSEKMRPDLLAAAIKRNAAALSSFVTSMAPLRHWSAQCGYLKKALST
jgi:hypothetical protein